MAKLKFTCSGTDMVITFHAANSDCSDDGSAVGTVDSANYAKMKAGECAAKKSGAAPTEMWSWILDGTGSLTFPVCQGTSEVLTCGDVKDEYKKQEFCGAPEKAFSMTRRLAGALEPPQGEAALVDDVRKALQGAAAAGGKAKAQELAKNLKELLSEYKATENQS